ncbi:MAG: peroxiredoxin [Gammaproteobacteria bacterium]|nr:peroxiredoxin [Gammaproteobacteria bacterium]NNJ91207.1 peroxiredoxin [Gammaproteobacteria bacterium]
MIQPGDKAPEFELADSDMNIIKSSDCIGQNYVVYFYPKDDTPGCTIEATEFTDLMSEFETLNTKIVGVSKDNCISHGNFRDKYGLTVRLLADVDGKMCETFGVWQEKEKNGVKKMGIVRSTFIIDAEGIVRHALYNVTPKGHAEQVLELVKAL